MYFLVNFLVIWGKCRKNIQGISSRFSCEKETFLHHLSLMIQQKEQIEQNVLRHITVISVKDQRDEMPERGSLFV